MTLVTRFCAALLVAATGLTGIAATPAVAQTSIDIQYRDRDRDNRRYDDRRDWRRDNWRGDRRDWRRNDWRRNNWDRGRGSYGYAPRRCWTDWRWDRWANRRVAVRVCR